MFQLPPVRIKKVAVVVSSVLLRHFPRDTRVRGRPPTTRGRPAVNLHRAVTERGFTDADRKLLEQVLTRSRRLSSNSVLRLAEIVDHIEPRGHRALRALLGAAYGHAPGPAALQCLEDSLKRPTSWAGLALPFDVSVLAPRERRELAERTQYREEVHEKAVERGKSTPPGIDLQRQPEPPDWLRQEIAESQAVQRMRDRRPPIDRIIAEDYAPNGRLPDSVKREVQAFRDRARRRGHPERRIEISVQRFLSPFCGWRRTRGLERGWHELSALEQKQVVKYGLRLEEIWLGTEPGLIRMTAGKRPGRRPTTTKKAHG